MLNTKGRLRQMRSKRDSRSAQGPCREVVFLGRARTVGQETVIFFEYRYLYFLSIILYNLLIIR